ncbi:plus-3-domain-containing protein [Rhodofomes roseus]|uniref:Plus-3-domain-containing protein n=1 Tax=Rhodofomes roseus TaxID=34475 RepID=A0ABQ8KCA8_9APHY|nr:plus-3-domain-containing protein [Rhodofomes roseus]KAH9834944.1 plus-3-domain-containing protein [Rhodofomes roseus]
MSDSEGDISDELLELAGATEKKRRKRQAQGSGAKRRRAEGPEEASDADQTESEDEEERNPYPFEGKYVDEADRQRLLSMSEIEREDILAQRQEEMQRIQDKRNLEQMLKAQSGHGEDSVSKAAKRQHTVRGATKEKTRKLDELRAKRREKDEKKRTRTNSPKRARSSSPADMDISDEEEEDGQISKFEEEEERDRRLYDKLHPEKGKFEDESITLEDLEKVRLSRDMLVRLSATPWFEETVKGAWVKYLHGSKDGQPTYRMFEVIGVYKDGRHYEFNGRKITTHLGLRYALHDRPYAMDRVSNATYTEADFDEWKSLSKDKQSFPTKRELREKSAQIAKNATRDITESDINEMLARNLQDKSSGASLAAQHARLKQMRMLATRRQDWKEVEQLDKQIADVEAKMPKKEEKEEKQPSRGELLAEVNRRNRLANMEAVRQAELREAERKRRERKLLAASGAGTPRAATPKNGLKPFSPRPGTPATSAAADHTTSPLPSSAASATPADTSTNFEASIIQSVEIDLGDF